MSNIVEFILKMKDLTKGPFADLRKNSGAVFASIDKGILGTQKNLKATIPSVNALSKRLDDLKKTRDISINLTDIKNANREIQRLEHRMDRMQNLGRTSPGRNRMNAGSAISMGKIAGAYLAYEGVNKGRELAGSAINMGLVGSAQKKSFQVLGGDIPGKQLYNDLTRFAQQSIFGNEVYSNAQTMLAFGASVKEVLPDLKMLGDISMGDKDRLSSLTLAFSQTRSAGKLMGQDLLQYVSAGFNPLQVMSDKSGVSMAKLRKEVEKGNISFAQVKQSFVDATSAGGKFYNMTNEMAKTPFGKKEAFMGKMQGIGLSIGTHELPTVGRIFDRLDKGADKFIARLPEILDKADSFIGGVFKTVDEFAPKIEKFGYAIWEGLKPAFSAFGSTQFKELGKSVIDLSTSITTTLTPAIAVLAEGAKAAAWLLNPLTKIISGSTRSIHSDLDLASPADELMKIINERKTIKGNWRNNLAMASPGLASALQVTPKTNWMHSAPGFTPLASSSPAGVSPTSGKGYTDLLADTNSKINGGGVRNITFNIGAIMKDVENKFYGTPSQMQEDFFRNFDAKVLESLNRVLVSTH